MRSASWVVWAAVWALGGCAASATGGAVAVGDASGADSSADAAPTADVASADAAGADAASADSAADSAQGDAAQGDAGDALDPGPVPSAMTVASCIDGQYTETPANPGADLGSLVANFKQPSAVTSVVQALQVRYPLGAWLLTQGATVPMNGTQTCKDVFFESAQAASFAGAVGQASTLVHECAHLYDNKLSGFSSHSYAVTESLKYTCSGLSYQGQNKGFARSLIKGDTYGAAWPACATWGSGGECDSYAPLYLDGNATDSNFDSGDQGYDMLLEEVAQYVNSLASDYAFADQSAMSTSAEDGILTFLWYMERYLHMARLQYPEVYSYLSGDPCWREATLTLWGRAWFYLEKSKGNPKLNLRGPMLRGLVATPDLLAEIELLRKAQGCAAK